MLSQYVDAIQYVLLSPHSIPCQSAQILDTYLQIPVVAREIISSQLGSLGLY
jgi:hypothetical protein